MFGQAGLQWYLSLLFPSAFSFVLMAERGSVNDLIMNSNSKS